MIRWFMALTLIFSSLLANIGEFTKVDGDVSIQRGSMLLPAAIGTLIEQSDQIKTAGKSRAELRFTDNTLINIGQNSDFLVEDYFFDQSADSRTTLKVTKGAFAAITGMIGKVAPKKFTIQTKTSTIGIRGTDFLGKITALGDTIACKGGAIAVGSIDLDIEPVIVEAGMVTIVKPGEAPTPPRPYTPGEVKNLEGVAGKGNSPDEGEPEPEPTPPDEPNVPEAPPEEPMPPTPPVSPEPPQDLPPPKTEPSVASYYYGYGAYLTSDGSFDLNMDPSGVRMTPMTLKDGSTVTVDYVNMDDYVFFSFNTDIVRRTDSRSGAEYNYLTWGSWDSQVYNPDYADPSGKQFFLAGDVTYYSDLPGSGNAYYAGSLTGQLNNSGSVTDVSGTVDFYVDFSRRTLDGYFSVAGFDSGSFESADIQSVGSYNTFGAAMTGGSSSGYYNGSFFGPNAEEMGGNWSLEGSQGETAGGIYAAQKSENGY